MEKTADICRKLNEVLQQCLINSDSRACNENISLYIKSVADYMQLNLDANYHQLSVFAMKLITLKMFLRNYKLCIGKLLGLLAVFTDVQKYQSLCRSTGGSLKDADSHEDICSLEEKRTKEFICIVLFLILKLKNSDELDGETQEFYLVVDSTELFAYLKCCRFVTIVANFMVSYIEHDASFIVLKFCGDIIFEYLFYVELLSDQEFENIVTRTELIPCLIKDLLLHNSQLDSSLVAGDQWENEHLLIAYEEFKLLLLINEQYLMKSYSRTDVRNRVFDGLMSGDLEETTDSINSNISSFMNLLVFHLNREESQIIKILILKFLYLIFTSSYTSKLYYLNDLKILVDIFIRELNDIEYLDEEDSQNRMLVLTYLKVMYPMLMFSQLADLTEGYKRDELINTLLNLILTISSASYNNNNNDNTLQIPDPKLQQISDLATRCMDVLWMKKKRVFKNPDSSSSSSSLASTSSNTNATTVRPLYSRSESSSDSIAHSFTRVASVKSFNRNDYHKHTIQHNEAQVDNLVLQNNNNIFYSTSKRQPSSLDKRRSNILDLPNEYLNENPRVPSTNNNNTSKAIPRIPNRKKAPPPPPPPRRRR